MNLPEDPFVGLTLERVVESADQAFQMLLAGAPKGLETSPVPRGFTERVFDYTGSIGARGDRDVFLSLGLSRPEIELLAATMMGGPVLDESILVGCHQELLNIVLGGTIGALSQLVTLKLGVPEMGRTGSFSHDPGREIGQILSFSSERIRLEFLLTVTLQFSNG